MAYTTKFFIRIKDVIDSFHPDLIFFDDTKLPLCPVRTYHTTEVIKAASTATTSPYSRAGDGSVGSHSRGKELFSAARSAGTT